jgi:hypothetical protein
MFLKVTSRLFHFVTKHIFRTGLIQQQDITPLTLKWQVFFT